MHSLFPEPFISRVVFSCCPQTSFSVSWRQELSLILLFFEVLFAFIFERCFWQAIELQAVGQGRFFIFFCNLTVSLWCPIVCIVSDQKYIVILCSVGVSCPFFSRHFTIAQLKKIFFWPGHTSWGNLSFPTRDWTFTPWIRRQTPSHWATREFPTIVLFNSSFHQLTVMSIGISLCFFWVGFFELLEYVHLYFSSYVGIFQPSFIQILFCPLSLLSSRPSITCILHHF